MKQEPYIVAVCPTEQYFSLNWQLSVRCNYDCMYCSPEWHDDHSVHHSMETMQQAWIKIYSQTQHLQLPYKIAFTGGELTTNKHFLPFLGWLKTNYESRLFKILITTNGSATYKYYYKMFQYVDNIAFSVHSEHIDEQKFFDTVIRLQKTIPPDKFLQVAIMDEFWNQERIPRYTELLQKHNVSYLINKIDHKFQTRTFPIMKGKLNLEV